MIVLFEILVGLELNQSSTIKKKNYLYVLYNIILFSSIITVHIKYLCRNSYM